MRFISPEMKIISTKVISLGLDSKASGRDMFQPDDKARKTAVINPFSTKSDAFFITVRPSNDRIFSKSNL